MNFNEEFNKEWDERVNEYETIPDKSKISTEDREFARGFYYAIDQMDGILFNFIDEQVGEGILGDIEKQIVEKYDKYAKEFMKDDFEELMISILDEYVE